MTTNQRYWNYNKNNQLENIYRETDTIDDTYENTHRDIYTCSQYDNLPKYITEAPKYNQ